MYIAAQTCNRETRYNGKGQRGRYILVACVVREERGTTLARAGSKIPPPREFPSREREGARRGEEISTKLPSWFPSSKVSTILQRCCRKLLGNGLCAVSRSNILPSRARGPRNRGWNVSRPFYVDETFRHVRTFDRTRLSIRFLTIHTWLRKLWRGEFRNGEKWNERPT